MYTARAVRGVTAVTPHTGKLDRFFILTVVSVCVIVRDPSVSPSISPSLCRVHALSLEPLLAGRMKKKVKNPNKD